jgi:hypothetical protein
MAIWAFLRSGPGPVGARLEWSRLVPQRMVRFSIGRDLVGRLLIALVTAVFVALLAGVSLPASATEGSCARGYDSPSSTYDLAAQCVQAHTSEGAVVASQDGFDGPQGIIVTAAGPLSVFLLKSVAVNSALPVVEDAASKITSLTS